MEQKHEDSARVLFIPFDSPQGEGLGSCRFLRKTGSRRSVWRHHFNLSFFFPKDVFRALALVHTQSSPFHLGAGAVLSPQVRASLQRAALLVRHGLNEVRRWARGHSWKERAPGLVSNIPVNPTPPGCSVHRVLRNSGMTPPSDNLKTQVFSLHSSKTLMPVC